MKFIVSSSVLLKELNSIAGVLNASNTLPILENFLFSITKKELVVSASDLESTMSTTITLDKSDKDGKIAIPAKLLLDTLKTFPEQPLTFVVNGDNFGIELVTDNGKYKLAGQNGDEFPKSPDLESPAKVDLGADVLSNAVNKTLFATGNDDLRPVMSGIFFEIGKDNLTFVATDAHKLVRYRRSDAKGAKAASFILPKKPATILKGLLSGKDGDVKVEYTDTNAHFSYNNVTLVSRLVDGKYPNYDAVIPKENPNKVTIDRNSMLASIKRVSIFSNKTTHQVRLKFAGNEMHVSAEDLDFSNEANERLSCNHDGEDIEIGFNSRFIIEMLTNIESENVILEMSASNRAGILTPSEGNDGDEELLMLVMPVMLNN
ncbi:MAG: DNA polymerase III subunit beta [Crocinitomicaceae bacterium]|nr:DNA polymerase III subunit beta [Crocinitomicaceae bacterium]|tara:strand:- start:11067 stop:12191 length:1125 start_codon:yes stop_codon:yes gene_type:complete